MTHGKFPVRKPYLIYTLIRHVDKLASAHQAREAIAWAEAMSARLKARRGVLRHWRRWKQSVRKRLWGR